jgi:excisionase family DNA binding protein
MVGFLLVTCESTPEGLLVVARTKGKGCAVISGNDRPLSEVRFLTIAEVASAMRVSKMTVYRLVHSGELPAVRVGRSFRVTEQAVHSYLQDSFVEAG